MIAGAIAFARAAWKFLGAIPWQAWAVAALLFAVWRYGVHSYEAGVADENARWVAAQSESDRELRTATARRDKAAEGVNAATTGRAHQATVETRTETAVATERARNEMRTVYIPADCPTGLPDSVRDEGRAAVERARAAGGPMRAGGNP